MSLNPWSAGLFDRVFPGADKNGQFRKQALSPHSSIAQALYRMLYDSRFRPSFTAEEMTAIILLRSEFREATMSQILASFRRLPYVYRVLREGTVAGRADIHTTLCELHHHLEAMTTNLNVTPLPAVGDRTAPELAMNDAGRPSGSDAQHWHKELDDGIQELEKLCTTTVTQDGFVVSATDTWRLYSGGEDGIFEDWYLHEAKLEEPTHIPPPIGRLPEELVVEILKYTLCMPTSLMIRAKSQPGIFPREVT